MTEQNEKVGFTGRLVTLARGNKKKAGLAAALLAIAIGLLSSIEPELIAVFWKVVEPTAKEVVATWVAAESPTPEGVTFVRCTFVNTRTVTAHTGAKVVELPFRLETGHGGAASWTTDAYWHTSGIMHKADEAHIGSYGFGNTYEDLQFKEFAFQAQLGLLGVGKPGYYTVVVTGFDAYRNEVCRTSADLEVVP